MIDSWFLIVNPSAGNKNFNISWNLILELLKKENISYDFAFTLYNKHEILLVNNALKQGYRKLISVGGDGTLHHVVNGIMSQRYIKTLDIKVAVIPLGTGNDWIKTYKIPNSIKASIKIIKLGNTRLQDIGCLHLESGKKEFFNNLAGIGYNAYVINKLQLLKKLGPISFLLTGLYSLLFYKKLSYDIYIKKQKKRVKCLMVLFGICRYSGGGLQITKDPSPNDGFLDITIVKNFSFLEIICNIHKLYNGKILDHKKIENYKVKEIKIIQQIEENSFIEGDGEIIGQGSLKVTIIQEALFFVTP